MLTDHLPYGTVFQSATIPPGWACTPPPSGKDGTVTCTVAVMEPGHATSSLVINVKVSAGPARGFLNNVAKVTSDTLDFNSANNSATATTAVTR